MKDFLAHWEGDPKNDKGLPARDENGEIFRGSNGTAALQKVWEQSPETYLRIAGTVFAAVTPKEHRADIGDNLAGFLEQLAFESNSRRHNGRIIDAEFTRSTEALEDKSD